MSYDIYIGEAEIAVPETEEEKTDWKFWVRVKQIKNPFAPVFPGDEMTGNSNCRSPGYSQWDGFCKAVGLHDLFFNRGSGLMAPHPGCMLVTKNHLDQIVLALKRWTKKHPDTTAGWCRCKECRGFGEGNEDHAKNMDGNKARLMWLQYWMSWALSNCKLPAIYNT